MATLHLVRHGHAAAGFAEDRDPGLDDEGHAQARAAAVELAPLGPLPVLVSPLRRCRETARPLEETWGIEAQIEPAITEVVSPVADLAGRAEWLGRAMSQRWAELEDEPRRWRERLLERVCALDADTVLVTHFIAVNALIGAARGDDRVLLERLGYASTTILECRDGTLAVTRTGAHGVSEVR